jgi:hypothetical protein
MGWLPHMMTTGLLAGEAHLVQELHPPPPGDPVASNDSLGGNVF